MKYFSRFTPGLVLDEVSGIWGQVGRKAQFPLQYFLYGSLPVLGSEGRGSRQHVVHQGSQGPPVHGLPVPRPEYHQAQNFVFYGNLRLFFVSFFRWRNLNGRSIKVAPGENLRRHVLDGATEGVSDGALVYRLLAQPEVCQLDVALGVQQDVLRL